MERRTLSRLISGKVMHRRHFPTEHRFVYPVFYLLLCLDEIDSTNSLLFGVNRKRAVSFNFRDYGDGRNPEIWIRELLDDNNIHDCNGPIWVQTFPRVFGYLFNPVSFWYCMHDDGNVGAIIAEVNNTFGEKHCYLLRSNPTTGEFLNLRAEKRLYVSPFYPVEGEYQFDFDLNFDKPKVRIDYFDNGQLQLNTAIWGKAQELSFTSIATTLIRQPFLTLGVFARIHWQAIRLWLKRVPLCKRPTPSQKETAK